MKKPRVSHRESPAPRRFAVLVFPGFPMMAFSAVIEPLRAANAIAGRPLYEWITVGSEAGAITASNGIVIAPDHTARNAPHADFIVICSGGDADRRPEKHPLAWIRKCLSDGAHIGSVADGAFYLARAGLLDNHQSTLHWQSQPAFSEAFPHLALVRSIYVIDRTRFTSAGGIGAFDMMLDMLTRHHGENMARRVAEWFVHDRIRSSTDRERLQLRLRTGIRDELVLDAAGWMESTIEAGGAISAIARHLGVSMGRLERAFRAELDQSPADFYRQMRMQRARDLLQHSTMSVREVGLACGYASFSSFVRAFRQTYRETPRKARKR